MPLCGPCKSEANGNERDPTVPSGLGAGEVCSRCGTPADGYEVVSLVAHGEAGGRLADAVVGALSTEDDPLTLSAEAQTHSPRGEAKVSLSAGSVLAAAEEAIEAAGDEEVVSGGVPEDFEAVSLHADTERITAVLKPL